MINPTIGFPPEADETWFAVTPVMPADRLEDLFYELLWREPSYKAYTELVDLDIENDWFEGRVRLELSSKHLSAWFVQCLLFEFDGPVRLLHPSGEESATRLHIGGCFDFSEAPPGRARIWHEALGTMLDAS